MQATQSKTASDLPNPDPGTPTLKPQSWLDATSGANRASAGAKTVSRPSGEMPVLSSPIFSSPILSPIAAARKYLERQRGDGSERQLRGGREGLAPSDDDIAPGRQQQAGELARNDSRIDFRIDSRTESRTESRIESRSQDRRLERSLYESHGDESDGSESHDDDRTGARSAAFLVKSDGGEELFSYDAPVADAAADAAAYAAVDAAPGPAPDPERVRLAISRLANRSRVSAGVPAGASEAALRQAETGWTAARARLTPPLPVSRSVAPSGSGLLSDSGRVPEPGFVASDVSRPGTAPSLPTAEVAAPLPFAEVARRLWGAGTAGAGTVGAGTGLDTAPDARNRTPDPIPDPTPDLIPGPISDLISGPSGPAESAATLPPLPPLHSEARHPGNWTGAATEAAGLREEGTVAVPRGAAGPQESDAPGGASANEVAKAVSGEAGPAGEIAGCAVDDPPALAHDACNLLSAVGLYGELLAFPGVLGEPHRHYAEELKLLATRSEVLIGRLLRSSAAASPAASAAQAAAGSRPESALPSGDPSSAPGHERRPEAGGASRGAAAASAPAVAARAVPELRRDHPARQDSAWRPSLASDGAQGVTGAAATPVASGGTPTNLAPRKLAPTDLARTNLVDLLMRWGSLLSTLAHGTLEVAFGPGAATPIPVGAEPLERILVNLVRNARAATVAGGSIRIGVGVATEALRPVRVPSPDAGSPASGHPDPRRQGREIVVLTVDDSGCGMSEAQVKRVLGISASGCEASGLETAGRERDGKAIEGEDAASACAPDHGVREHGERRRRGLGLQIVRELVAASGGELFLQSMPGRGTRIEIHWPTVRSFGAAAADSAPAEPAPRAASVPPALAPDTTRKTGIEKALPEHPAAVPAGLESGLETGLGEEQLRSMMLRLHRSAPGERIRAGTGARVEALRGKAGPALEHGTDVPRSGGLPQNSSPFASARSASAHLPSAHLPSAQFTDHGEKGEAPTGGAASTGNRTGNGVLFPVATGTGSARQGADRNANDESGLKGAIAC